jgi:hypothetical protein
MDGLVASLNRPGGNATDAVERKIRWGRQCFIGQSSQIQLPTERIA